MNIKKSITGKYLAAFLSMIVIPIIVIAIAIYTNYKNILLDNTARQSVQLLEQTASTLDANARSLSLTLSSLANDQELMELLIRWNRTEETVEKYNLSKEIDHYLKRTSNYLTEINTVVFYFKEQGFYYYGTLPVISEAQVRTADWYAPAQNAGHQVTILNSLTSISSHNSGKHFVSAAICPKLPNFQDDVELIYISCATNALDSFFKASEYRSSSDLVILDRDNTVLLSQENSDLRASFGDFSDPTDPGDSGSSSTFEKIGRQTYMITSSYVNKTGWHLLSLADVKSLTAQLNTLFYRILFIFAVILGLFLIFSFIFFGNIIVPINRLIGTMRGVEKGNFDLSIEMNRSDELYQLGSSFNRMISEIKRLITERDLKEKERSEAEMEALQAQINPHFVANTLSTIRFMAMIAKADNIKEMTEAFINIVTSTFNRGSRFHTVEKEIDVIESYLYIMKVRQGNRFDVSIEAGEDAKTCYMLKMLVQPIVENAIIHGLNEMEEKGQITLRFYKQEAALTVEVEDNGHGIEPERIQTLLTTDQRNPKGFTGLGVRNVDQRIKLNHGDAYGLSIDSEPGRYTRFTIRLPLLTEAEFDEKS